MDPYRAASSWDRVAHRVAKRSITTMSGSLRLALILLGIVFAGYFAVHIVTFLVGKVLALLIPVLVIGAIVGALYFAVNRKALGGSRRTLP